MPKLENSAQFAEDGESVSRFLNAIDAFVKTESSAVDSEFIEVSSLKNQTTEEKISREIDNMLKEKLESYKKQISVDLSIKKLQEKKKLCSLRNKLLNDLWIKCEESLQRFVSSENYKNYLESACRKIKNYIDSSIELSNSDIRVFVMESDLIHEGLIKKNFGETSQLLKTSKIKIGGIRVSLVNSSQILDETIDEKFLLAKSKFIHKFASTICKAGENLE